eukprot:1157949-Pelagomonas_calceolata.AAC.3
MFVLTMTQSQANQVVRPPAAVSLLGYPDCVLNDCDRAVGSIEQGIGMQHGEPKAEQALALGCEHIFGVQNLQLNDMKIEQA